MLKLLSDLKNEKYISELNYQFAKLIDQKQQGYGYSEQQQNLAIFLAGLVSFQVMQGHSCLRLNSAMTENPFGLSYKKTARNYIGEIMQKIGQIDPLKWQSILSNHIAFSDNPAHTTPMLFQHGRLYFYRYWQAENRIASALQQRVALFQTEEDETGDALNSTILARFFTPQTQIDWQKVAVATALKKPFCLISGGPGTGKTRTVAILLAALQLKQLESGLSPLKIGLSAPTGKAASRLKESIADNLAHLDLPESLKQSVPKQASTLHSLLGIHPHSDQPTYHADNPLHLDLLVVDEASMIDLFVMEKLFNALKPSTRLIMLGDKDQLASVEAGNAMSELGRLLTLEYSQSHSDYLSRVTGYPIISKNRNVPLICDTLCHLRHSYRFKEDSGIGQLASYINAQQAPDSWRIFTNPQFSDLERVIYPTMAEFSDKTQWIQQCVNRVVASAVSHYSHYLSLVKQRLLSPETVSVGDIFHAFQQVRFLSALRVSELGVERLNQAIAEALQHARWVDFHHSRESYAGKPVLITENARQNKIFSGDIGIFLPDEQGKLRVYFDTETEGEYRSISPSRLPSYEPAYVMTVHKSQGSEFEHTLLVMPLNTSPVLTKELLYTAVTRAKKRFTLFGEEKVWRSAVMQAILRQSGLNEQLSTINGDNRVEE